MRRKVTQEGFSETRGLITSGGACKNEFLKRKTVKITHIKTREEKKSSFLRKKLTFPHVSPI